VWRFAGSTLENKGADMNELNVAAIASAVLAEADVERVREVLPEAVEKILHAKKENVVGVGIGHKWVDGQPTAEACIHVYVKKKVEHLDELPLGAAIQEEINGVQTDVIETGEIVFESYQDRIRPLEIGYSLGAQFEDEKHTGTLGAFVTKMIDGEPHYFVLSNNHVLAANNGFDRGTLVRQPGPGDGGGEDDICGQLWDFVPKSIDVPNSVDAAIATVLKAEISKAKAYVPDPQTGVAPGLNVRKTGKRTGSTEGLVLATNVTVKVKSKSGALYEFTEQIKASYDSAGGDSGALVIATETNKPVGLHFAGSKSKKIAFFNKIDNVLTALGVDLY